MTVPSSLTLNDARRRCHAPACDEPGEAACGSDVIAETPGRPPRRYPGVLDNVAMNGIKDAVAGQRYNDDPRVRFEPSNSRSREQRHHHRLEDDCRNRTAHSRAPTVTIRTTHHHRRC